MAVEITKNNKKPKHTLIMKNKERLILLNCEKQAQIMKDKQNHERQEILILSNYKRQTILNEKDPSTYAITTHVSTSTTDFLHTISKNDHQHQRKHVTLVLHNITFRCIFKIRRVIKSVKTNDSQIE